MPLFRPTPPLIAILLAFLASISILTTTCNASTWSLPGSKFVWSSNAPTNCKGDALRHESVSFHTTPHCERDSPTSSFQSQCTPHGGYIRTKYPSSAMCKGWWMKEFVATNRCFFDSLPTVFLCPGDTNAEQFIPMDTPQLNPNKTYPLVGGSSYCGEGGEHGSSDASTPCRGPRIVLFDDSPSCQGLPQTLVLFQGLTHRTCSFDTSSGSYIKAYCDDYRSIMKIEHYNGGTGEKPCDDALGPYKYVETSYGACRTISSRKSVLYLCE